jgi:two-component system chemotaxis sensor kinase CheA
MAIDIGQFVQTFFEESLEGLDVMEAGLLALQPGAADLEQINTIFRAAHSIKGGSGTFGFQAVTGFTHVMETLLDQMRNGRLEVSGEAVNTLLESVDCLREMLVAALRGNAGIDEERVGELRVQLEQLLEQNQPAVGKAAPGVSPPQQSAASQPAPPALGWRIAFRPHPDLMHRGNDPVRIFRELSALGRVDRYAGLPPTPAAGRAEAGRLLPVLGAGVARRGFGRGRHRGLCLGRGRV